MRFVICGMSNAYIEEIDAGLKVDTAYVYTKSIDNESAEIVVDVDFTDYECGGIVDVSIIDFEGKKVAGHSRYNEESFMRINLDIEKPKLWYPNGYGEAQKLSLKWYAVSKEGKVVFASDAIEIFAEDNTSSVALELNSEKVPESCFVVADINNDRAFYKKGALEIRGASNRIAELEAESESVRIKANAYIHAVELCGDAVFEDNYFSMLPGEERTVKYTKTGKDDIRAEAYTI